jgi:hypothetical protein
VKAVMTAFPVRRGNVASESFCRAAPIFSDYDDGRTVPVSKTNIQATLNSLRKGSMASAVAIVNEAGRYVLTEKGLKWGSARVVPPSKWISGARPEGDQKREGETMTKRRAVWIGAAVFVVGLCLIGLSLPEPGSFRAGYRRVKVGMSESEVDALLGGPASMREKFTQRSPAPDGAEDGFESRWVSSASDGSSLIVWVQFDKNARVVSKDMDSIEPLRPLPRRRKAGPLGL